MRERDSQQYIDFNNFQHFLILMVSSLQSKNYKLLNELCDRGGIGMRRMSGDQCKYCIQT